MAGQPQEPSWSPHPPAQPGYNPPPPQAAQQQYGYPPPGNGAPGYAPGYGEQTQAYAEQQQQAYADQTQVYGGRPQDQGYPQDYGQGAGQSLPPQAPGAQSSPQSRGALPPGALPPGAQQWQEQWQGQGQDQSQWQTPSPQTFRPSRPAKSAKSAKQGHGFVSSLFDFGFTSFVTPKIIKVLYVLVTIWTMLWALAFLDIGFRYGHAAGGLITLIIIDPILILVSLGVFRVVLEFFMVSFRMQEDLKALRESSAGSGAETSSDSAANGG
ncbi:MAG: DUF4282 domain-containing protein [Trebonia sp.]